jgi:hypothetical protein
MISIQKILSKLRVIKSDGSTYFIQNSLSLKAH